MAIIEMKQEIKDQWIEALRSGQYRKGKYCLRAVSESSDTWCCLGVLTDLARKDGIGLWYLSAQDENGVPFHSGECFDGWEQAELTQEVVDWAGIRFVDPENTVGSVYSIPIPVCDGPHSYNDTLAELNDSGDINGNELDFLMISDIIKDNVGGYGGY